MTRDFVRSLVFREAPPARWAGRSRDLLKFLPPGSYVAHLEVPHLGARKLVSNDFEFTVVEAEGGDLRARDRIGLRHVDFLEGRDVPMDESAYRGGLSPHGADRTHYKDIQKILVDYPDSTYAEWIRFWKVYHHGSSEEALEYARTHWKFPLSDNLMLRAINRVANDDEQHERAQELLHELQRLFPKGDTRPAALMLQEKLAKKKKRSERP